ncbi:MAG TPA: hypothetical protein VKY90_21100 [Candidatus Dormibacteraeota bacterium]|nr:hypothetical protein [Candidatus Dormibacteraeota bacterium]
MDDGQKGSERRGVRRLGIHVLGAADLDALTVEEFARELAALGQLPDGDARWERLSRKPQATSPAGADFATTPLLAALRAECDGLLLIATRQDPPHTGDTWRLAELARPLLEERELLVRVVEVGRFDVDGFREATEAGLRQLASQLEIGEVVLVMGGGPKVGFIAALLGMVQAGHLPQVLEPQREGEAHPAPRLLRLEADLVPWLVRTHQYDVLASLGEVGEVERRVWRALAAAQALDWRALGQVEVGRDDVEATRQRHPGVMALDLPRPPDGVGSRPTDEAGWRWYRRVLQASFLIRAMGDPASALYLARPWTDCHVHELAYQDPINRQHPLVRALDGPEADEALGRLLDRWSELAPGPIRALVGTPAVQQLCRLGGLASHGRPVGHDWPYHHLDALAALAEDLGLGSAPPVGGGLLLLLAVGQTENREARGWTPEQQAQAAVDAIVQYLAFRLLPRGRVHLRLVSSERVRTHAQRVRDLALQRRFGSVEAIEVHPEGTRAALGEVGRWLEGDPRLASCSEALLVVGPGTKQMNVVVTLAGGQWGTNRALPLRVAYLHERKSGGEWSSVLEETRERVLPRLGPDEVVAPILRFALRRLDLGTVRWALELGSDRWSGLEPRVVELQRLLTPVGGGREAPDPRVWFPARARAFATLAQADPWRAIYATCAAAEAAWPAPTKKAMGGNRPAPWRVLARPHGHRLWRVRNEGPFGHRVWALPPPAGEVRQLIEGVIEEVEQDPPKGPVTFKPGDTILQRVEELVEEVHRLAPPA